MTDAPPRDAAPGAGRRPSGPTFAAGTRVPFAGDFACGNCGHVVALPDGAAFPACPACSEPKVVWRLVRG